MSDSFDNLEKRMSLHTPSAIVQKSKDTKKPDQKKQDRARRYCFTSYHALEKESYRVLETHPQFRYCVVGSEVCPTTGRQHIQGYVSFTAKVDFNTLKKLLPDDKSHIEQCKGTELDNMDYCMKEGNYLELGIPGTQGSRTDIKTAYAKSKTLKEFIANYPDIYTRYKAGVEGYYRSQGEDYIIEEYKPLVIWLYGDTGRGKTRVVRDYLKVKRQEGYRLWRRPLGTTAWFDGYANQDIVFLDEIRGSTYKFDDLLQMLDYDCPKVPVKGGFTEFRPKILLITSNTHPRNCYTGINSENKQQLVRRCDFIKKVTYYEPDLLINAPGLNP